jgi:O-antigen/teichoic acid export membrane protein
MLRALCKSASLRAAAVLGLGGLAFTLANLIFARTLPSGEYGLISLVVGIVSVAGLAAPLGLDLVIGRRGLRLDSRLRRAILGISTAVGLVTAAVSALFYRLDGTLLICIFVTTIACGLMQASAAHFQGQQRFGPAVWIVQLSNWTLLFAALLAALVEFETAVESCAVLALASAVGAAAAWVLAARRDGPEGSVQTYAPRAEPVPARALLGEAFSLVTIHTSNAAFLQLERLLLAPIAGVQALALFGVVAALVASPFRMLQMAVLFTLIPGLRQAGDVEERRRLLRREMLLVAGVIGAGSVGIWNLAPPLSHWFLSGRYDLSAPLMCAALVSGILKLCSAFATGTVIALAEDKGLRTLSAVSWATLGLSVVAAFAAAPWGLVGVLYGISAGWLIRSLIAAWMALPHLRRPRDGTAIGPSADGFARHG